jgi:hypothetical protein
MLAFVRAPASATPQLARFDPAEQRNSALGGSVVKGLSKPDVLNVARGRGAATHCRNGEV